jgi:molecular chaperone HtpG
VGQSDGTFTIGDALTPLAEPGTEVRLRPRHGFHRWCDTDACTQYAGDFAELLDVPVHIAGETLSQQTPPWRLSLDHQLAWCRDRFGFEAMGIIPFDSSSSSVAGLAFVLPYTARPGYRTGDRIYSKGMLVADTDDLIVPRWAFFCRAVIDVGDLPLTASREGLQESAALQFARKQIGFRLLTELIIVQSQHPDVYLDIVRLHADGLKALAVSEPDVRDLLRATLPYETTVGDRTIQQLVDRPQPVPYVRDADTYHALSDIAEHAGVLVVNASGLHEADLLQIVDEEERGHFREVGAQDVVELARPTPHPDVDTAQTLVAKAQEALTGERLEIGVAGFEPADRPVLWWPVETADPATGSPRATLLLNSSNNAVKRLLTTPPETDISAALRALYLTGLLAGRGQPTVDQVALLKTAVLDMIEETLTGGE